MVGTGPPTNTATGRTPYGYPALPRDIDTTKVTNIPSGFSGKFDRPFLGMATGLTSAADTQFIQARSIDDTLLRSFTTGGKTGRLLQASSDISTPQSPPTHPYLQYQLLNKIYNNVTNRSNVFAIWVTVGFFEVEDATTTPPKLGKEIGAAEGRQVRHRMFAIVDRTNMAAAQTATTAATVTIPTAPTVPPAPTMAPWYGQPLQASGAINVPTSGTDSRTNRTWAIGPGSVLVYEPNTNNEETVVVQTGNVATFTKNHAANATVIVRGNPGPWLRYDPRQDSSVLIHWSVIE
jgi:hypothetical protein